MSMTISQLKQELINHGVAFPESNARKEAYEKLYQEHVVKVKSAKAPVKGGTTSSREADFSSDEDVSNGNGIDFNNATLESYLDPLVAKDVDSLTNEEIYSALVDLGQIIGPVVSTTREMYKRRLTKLRSCQNGHKDDDPIQEGGENTGYEEEIHINGQGDNADENSQQFSSDDDTSEPAATVNVSNEKFIGLSDKEKDLLKILMTSRREKTTSSTSEVKLKMKSLKKGHTGNVLKQEKTNSGIKTWLIALVVVLLAVYIAFEYYEESIVEERHHRNE